MQRQTRREAARGEPHLKSFQEGNKFHWSLKSLQLVSSSTLSLKNRRNRNEIIWASPQKQLCAATLSGRCHWSTLRGPKMSNVIEVLTMWFSTGGLKSSRTHQLTIIGNNQSWQVIVLSAYNKIKSCYYFTMRVISDACLFFNCETLNHLPPVRNEGGNVSPAQIASPYGSVWFACAQLRNLKTAFWVKRIHASCLHKMWYASITTSH